MLITFSFTYSYISKSAFGALFTQSSAACRLSGLLLISLYLQRNTAMNTKKIIEIAEKNGYKKTNYIQKD